MALAAVVVTLVPLVKKLFAVGAVTLVPFVPPIKKLFAVTAATLDPLVKNVFGVEVTLVTTCCEFGVPLTTGTVRSGPILPVPVVFVTWRLPDPLLPGEKAVPLLKR
jgi:hypothetical protein